MSLDRKKTFLVQCSNFKLTITLVMSRKHINEVSTSAASPPPASGNTGHISLYATDDSFTCESYSRY